MKLQTVLGKKMNMTSRFDANGMRVPVTVVAVEPNTVLAVRSQETDGYMAVQLATGSRKHANKPMLGNLKKANLEKAPRFIKEARFFETPDVSIGDKVNVSEVIEAGDMVSVQGVSKGKGFQGGIKRWGFHGGPATHGQSDRHRAPGSIGSGTTPGRVYKGKKMAGRMGNDTVTVKNLEVFTIDEKNNVIEVMGSVPGARGSYIVINVTGKNKKHVGPAVKEEEPVVEENLDAAIDPGAEQVLAQEEGITEKQMTEDAVEDQAESTTETSTEQSEETEAA